MNEKQKPRAGGMHVFLWAGVLTALMVLTAVAFGHTSAPKASASAEGAAFLTQAAQKDPAVVESVLHERYVRALELQALSDDPDADAEGEFSLKEIWSKFQDFVLLGDSRAVGFYYYKFLDKSNVFAEGGNTIRDIPKSLDTIKSLQPSTIYLCYGLNDTGIGYWNSGEEYAAEMKTRLEQLHEAAPNAVIVVNSILPATEAAYNRSPRWRKIPEFSEAVKTLCETVDYTVFVDNDALCAAHMELWDPDDGVHLQKAFYPYWARNMIIAMAKDGLQG